MPTTKALATDSVARYEIRLQGYLDQRWMDCLNTASIGVASRPGEASVTVVAGEFQDQTALAGALSLLYDLGLPLLSVECIGVEANNFA